MDKISTGTIVNPGLLTDISSSNIQAEKAKSLSQKKIPDEKEAKKAASNFEALLLHQMIKTMWSTVGSGGLMGENSNQAQIYRDMLNQAIADKVAEGKGIGVKDFLFKELTKQQATSNIGKDGMFGALTPEEETPQEE